ncbi:MAG TPA: putative glycoside hydrolase [Firmicutes bacterium]|nr:putative glycoside hydrolase [Bacillota bacterium]
MKRTKKIKRYNRIYRTGRHRVSALQVILITVGCLALFFVGFSVIGPISDYLSGKLEPAPSSAPVVPVSDSSSEDTSEVSSDTGTVVNPATHSAYLPASAVQDLNGIETLLSQFQALDINNVVIELKDEEGVVYYNSQVEAAQNAGVISSDAVDLAAVIERFTAGGITVTAKLHAFQDDPAAKYLGGLSASSDAVVRYRGDTSYVWVDAAVNDGGKRWLNPYSDAAQKYIQDLADELVSMGCANIMLDSVQFPSGEALNMTDYGSKQDTMTKQEALQGFISGLDQDLSAKGAKLIVEVPAMAAIEEQEDQYGGNVLTLGAQYLALDLMPSELGNSITVGEQTISPAQNPAEAVRAILAQAKANMGTSAATELIAVLEKGNYTQEQAEAQKAAAQENGVESYLLYSEDGDYQF